MGGNYHDFPYGVSMVAVFAPLFIVGKLVSIDLTYSYFCTLFLAELTTLYLLGKISDAPLKKLLFFFWFHIVETKSPYV